MNGLRQRLRTIMRNLLLPIFLVLTLPSLSAAFPVKTGAHLLVDNDFSDIAGKRVGLVTNHTAMVDGVHLIDLLADSDETRLVALFAPEHGLRGTREDGVPVPEGRDSRTGITVFSLYGDRNKPTPAMLDGVDLLLFDIQDIGARFYTFISTMGLAMQAAAAANIPFIVLDRPNPLGGEYLGGPLLETDLSSFVGLYPIPVAHGMTVGELAFMIKGERMLPGLEELDLGVAPMEGWERSMQWPDTGLPWIRTSPNIPDFETALLYPGLCLLEATVASEGRGTLEPFRLAGAPGIDGDSLAEELNACQLPGIRFEPAEYTPGTIPGMSSRPKYRDRTVGGVRLTITDRRRVRPVETGLHLLAALYGTLDLTHDKFFRSKGFDRLAGAKQLRNDLELGIAPDRIIAGWEEGIRRFDEQRKRYLLY